MATLEFSPLTNQVQKQYTDFPYPYRDPAKEDKRLLLVHMDALQAINHYCYRGRRDFARGMRVLVAGGGTGDSTVCLAAQLANTDSTIVHLDLSEASIEVARQRVRRRGIEKNVRFEKGSLLDLPKMGWAPFDYINCVGVLHHLEDPPQGLAALKSVLKPAGAMGLMLYARYGRTAIYHMQALMRLINRDEQDPQVLLDNLKRTLKILPESNWLKHKPISLLDKEEASYDTEYYDTFLHSQDRAYSVPEVYEYLQTAGLHLVEFAPNQRVLYDPRVGISNPRLLERIDRLPLAEQQAVSELIFGSITKHSFWASASSDTIADPRDPENVPVLGWNAQLAKVVEQLARHQVGERVAYNYTNDNAQYKIEISINQVNKRLFQLVDGRRTMGQIVETIVQDCGNSVTAENVWDICCTNLKVLGQNDLILLEHISVNRHGDRKSKPLMRHSRRNNRQQA